MPKKPKLFTLLLIMASTLLLAGCFVGEKEASKTTYETGLPEANDARIHMLNNYMASYHPRLVSNEEINIYQKDSINLNNKEISYFHIEDNTLTDQWNQLKASEEPADLFGELWNNEDYMTEIADLEKWHLPKISLKNDQLHITTNETVEQLDIIDLAKENNIELSQELLVDILAVNEEAFHLQITDVENDHEISNLFLSQDLSRQIMFEDTTEALEQFINSESFASYENLFQKINDTDHLLNAFTYQQLIDTEQGEIITIHEDDLLSKDSQYVFIDGHTRTLNKESPQVIQETKDYLEKNDEKHASFKLDYKKIAQEAGISKSSGISISKVVYLDENLVILYLSYKGPFVGTAGQTNVIIDLSDQENLTYYLEDLDLNSYQ